MWGTGTTTIIKVTILFIATIATIIIISATVWTNYYYSELEDIGNASVKQSSNEKKKKKLVTDQPVDFLEIVSQLVKICNFSVIKMLPAA